MLLKWKVESIIDGKFPVVEYFCTRDSARVYMRFYDGDNVKHKLVKLF